MERKEAQDEGDAKYGEDGEDGDQKGNAFGFNDLNEDCLFDVLKYLSFAERAKFERTSKKFGVSLARVWFHQKVVLISRGISSWTEFETCHERDHRFSQIDVWPQMGFKGSQREYEESSYSIIGRCLHLKALFWEGPLPVGFGRFVAEVCPTLEHITIQETSGSEQNLYNLEKDEEYPMNIRCLHLESSEVLESQLIWFLKLCPKVTTFVNLKGKMTVNIINVMIENLKDLRVDYLKELDPIVDLIVEKGHKLERLLIHEHDVGDAVVEEKHVQAICKNMSTRIKALDLWSHPHNIIYLRSLTKLEELSWWPGYNGSYDEGIFKHFLKGSRRLKSLELFISYLKDSAYDTISECCPNLERLSLLDGYTLTDELFDYVCKLKKLKKLRLCNTRVTDGGVIRVLRECPKIASVSVHYNLGLTVELMDAFVVLANKYPKRLVTGCFFRVDCEEELDALDMPPNLSIN